MRAPAALLAVAAMLACSPAEKPAANAAAPKASPPGAAAASAVTNVDGEDPEPPDAQAKAEAVLHDPVNADKTTRLTMSMTSIIGQTSSLQGIGTQLAASGDKIDESLSRLKAKVTETEVLIQLPGAILFDFDSANIRPDAARALTDVANVIRSYAQRPVRVEGHTDSIASDEYNLALSEKRAKAVVDWLAGNGVERGRLTPAGMGEAKPMATNDTAAGRQLNRRVEVVIARK